MAGAATRRAAAGWLGAALLLAAGCSFGGEPAADESEGTVARVVDGDTLALEDGRRVRLVQIDAPEVPERECHGADSAADLLSLVPEGTDVRLVRDPNLDDVDRFERLLRYVFVGERNVNLELVRLGAAAPYFFGGGRGRYAERLLDAAEEAQDRGAGLWSACPGTVLHPGRTLATGPERL